MKSKTQYIRHPKHCGVLEHILGPTLFAMSLVFPVLDLTGPGTVLDFLALSIAFSPHEAPFPQTKHDALFTVISAKSEL
jgi:hypothetical protein